MASLTDIFDILDDDLGDDEYEQDFDFDYIRTNVDDEEMIEDDPVEHTSTVSKDACCLIHSFDALVYYL